MYDILRKKGRLDALTAVSYALDIARYIITHSFSIFFTIFTDVTLGLSYERIVAPDAIIRFEHCVWVSSSSKNVP